MDTVCLIPNAKVAKLWGQGFVNVRKIKQDDNLASYLSAYLTDIDLENLDDDARKMSSDRPKNVIKGGRLTYYPLHFKIFRVSRQGIKKPLKIKGYKEDIQEKYDIVGKLPSYYKKLDLPSNDAKTYSIELEYYSKKRAELQKAIDKIKREC